MTVAAVSRAWHELLLDLGPDLFFTHDLGHRVLANLLVLSQQCAVDPGTAINAASLLMRHSDLPGQFVPTLPTLTGGPISPGVKPAGADLQHLARRLNRELVLMLLNPCELHGCSLAKNAAAFF